MRAPDEHWSDGSLAGLVGWSVGNDLPPPLVSICVFASCLVACVFIGINSTTACV